LFINNILPKDFDLNKIFLDLNIIINIILNIIEYKASSFYKLIIIKPYFKLLFNSFYRFKLIINYDSFALTKNDIRIYEIVEIKKKVKIRLLFNAAKAIRKE